MGLNFWIAMIEDERPTGFNKPINKDNNSK